MEPSEGGAGVEPPEGGAGVEPSEGGAGVEPSESGVGVRSSSSISIGIVIIEGEDIVEGDVVGYDRNSMS